MTPWALKCVRCNRSYPALDPRYRCDCSGTLDVIHDPVQVTRETFDARRGGLSPADQSGVWRFRELILPVDEELIVARNEGNTTLYDSPKVAQWVGLDRLRLKHEGENPTGSFKDRGMTVGVTMARVLGMETVACASTGNTSASMASYAAIAGLKAIVFIPEGKIAYGKLCQSIAYGAQTIQINGDFDAAMELVQKVCLERGIYLLNSVNPFRIEGQKAIGFELLQDLAWDVPDWIVLPGGNLGNNSALSKGLLELESLGLIDRLPRIAVVQAAGANPLYRSFIGNGELRPVEAQTLASAIRIGNPVSFRKSVRGLEATRGVVTEVTDQQILDAKAVVDAAGIGAEPASCATVAGARRLVQEGVIRSDETVCGILTGHLLKDPDVVVQYHKSQLEGFHSSRANPPVSCEADLEAVLRLLA